MGLLDRGTEVVTIYPSILGDDGYGTPTRLVGTEGVTFDTAIALPGSGTETATDGQAVAVRYTLVMTILDPIDGLDAFAEVEWRDQRWDVVGAPTRFAFPTKRAGLTFITVQAR